MLGRLVRELPRDGVLYEPKWDGFRCLVFRDRDEVDLRSRNDRELARYFPELVAALRGLRAERFVLDGELLVPHGDGYDFTSLMARLHPAASRVAQLSAATPAVLMAFDLLAVGDADLRERPFEERRARLEALLDGGPPELRTTEITADPGTAEGWLRPFEGGGVDGVMAKPRDLPYLPGARAMLKVKLERTLDCVVAGFRLLVDRPLPSSLLLGLHDESGELRHVGLASSFSERLRGELLDELRPLVVPLEGHPWEHGFLTEGSAMGRLKGAAARWAPDEMELDWVPVEPSRVAEVAYEHIDSGRLRHPARFRRWRPDREPGSCTFDQLR
ncbi:MAG: ATP-dependent DNA ligase [Actinomycetota bacterium]|nr:ATP-dependent DNA ligase [Actinomycetota bacterium]